MVREYENMGCLREVDERLGVMAMACTPTGNEGVESNREPCEEK